MSEKTDDTLFVLDTASVKKEEQLDSKKQKKERSRKKALKCFSLLLPDPNSKPVRTPDGESFKKGRRIQTVTNLKEQKFNSKTRVFARQQRLKENQLREERRAKKRSLPVVEEDIWAEPADEKTHVTVKPPKKYRKKPSALPPTIIPHPGASVNPSYEDHQELLLLARETEVGKYKEEQKLKRALDDQFPSKADAPTKADYLVEMSAGLIPSSDEDDSDQEDGGIKCINPPVRREDRKSRKKRRRELEVKLQQRNKKTNKAAKQRENMIMRIPTLKAEIKIQEKVFKERAKERDAERAQSIYKTKRLGKVKYAEPDLDLKLSEELVGSLREIKPEGHLLNDVYKSLQKRNIIEPRIQQKKKRTYKPKVFEKKTHKEVTL